jgi:hypothetical protein
VILEQLSLGMVFFQIGFNSFFKNKSVSMVWFSKLMLVGLVNNVVIYIMIWFGLV